MEGRDTTTKLPFDHGFAGNQTSYSASKYLQINHGCGGQWKCLGCFAEGREWAYHRLQGQTDKANEILVQQHFQYGTEVKLPTDVRILAFQLTVYRLMTWYSIVTVLVRCPTNESLLDETSPKICKPYFQARNIVTPHLSPYYETYAAPYVAKAQPYYDVLDAKVISPTTAYAKKHGAPRAAQAQAYGQAQWERSVQPQITKLTAAGQHQYERSLGPHIDKFSSIAMPYYQTARDNAHQTYHSSVLPTYRFLQPYAVQAYNAGNEFAVSTGIPYAKWAWVSGIVFLDRTVWPRIRILYGENVEPQLVRIGERLGRYRDGKRLKAAVAELNVPSSVSSISASISSASSALSTQVTQTTATDSTQITFEVSSSLEPKETSSSREEMMANAKATVAEDLKTWQEKFAKAADEGSDELDERITEITTRAVENQAAGVGEARLIELEETVRSSLSNLKAGIIGIVKNAGDDVEASEEKITIAVRSAGTSIKDKAQAVRSWRQNYDQETNSLISKAAEDTFDIIDHIRDLGLQEIGMRWAWTDGITHKDWQKYHALKKQFDEWRLEVEQVATTHPGLGKARAASEDIENRAMAIAEDAVKELSRVKETGRWKLSASDLSDDWTTKHMPAAAVVAGAKIAQKAMDAKDAVVGKAQTQGTIDSISSIMSASASEAVAAASSIISSAGSAVTSAADQASSSVVGTSTGTVERVVSALSSSAASIADAASSSIIGTQQGTIKSVLSVASVSASSIASSFSPANSVLSDASSSASSIADVASSSVGRFASEASNVIIGTEQGMMESVGSVLSSKASTATEAISSSLTSVSSSATSIASEASASVIGTSKGTLESVASLVSASASSVSDKVSSSIIGTTPGVIDQASSIIDSAISVASLSGSSASKVAESSIASVSSEFSKTATSASSEASSIASSATASVKKVWGGAMAQHVEERKIVYEDIVDDNFSE